MIKILLILFVVAIWKWDWLKQLSIGWKLALSIWSVVGIITFVIWIEIAKVW